MKHSRHEDRTTLDKVHEHKRCFSRLKNPECTSCSSLPRARTGCLDKCEKKKKNTVFCTTFSLYFSVGAIIVLVQNNFVMCVDNS